MSTNSYRLYGAPRIFPGESLSSWLQRLSQQQGISIEKLFFLVGAKVPKDFDSNALSTKISNLIDMCGLSLSDFAIVNAVGRSIEDTKLLRQSMQVDHIGRPVTAFCPECLENDYSPYFRIEWRFKFWKFCPEHLLPMVTSCGNCQKGLTLDRLILFSRAAPPSLAYCKFCLSKLVGVTKASALDESNIKEKIWTQRNMMAGILNGYCMIAPYEEKFTLRLMVFLHQFDLLLPTASENFNESCEPKRLLELANFLNRLQFRIRSNERVEEQAMGRKRRRSTPCITSFSSRPS